MNDHPQPHTRLGKRGMTLIEVTVTVGAVALLASMLLPTLGEARRQGKEVQCLHNLARIAEASAVYAAADRSEHAVPVHWLVLRDNPGGQERAVGEIEWGGKSGRGEPLAGNDPVDSKWGTANGHGPASRPLNKVIYGDVLPEYQNNRGPGSINWINDYEMDLDMFRCPGDYGYTGYHYEAWKNSGLTSFDHYGNSYTANALWVRYVPGPSNLFSNSPFFRPLSRVPAPARTIMYQENCGRFSWRINHGEDGCGGSSGGLSGDVDKPIRGWHGRKYTFTAAFSDGRVGVIRMAGHEIPQPRIGRYPNHPDGVPFDYDNYHCVIIRGEDWRLDTLPAPPVDTGIPVGSRGVPFHPIE